MTARGDPAEDGIVLRDGERGWRRRGEKIWPRRALGEQVAGQAKRQRCLAGAARPAEDEGVGQPALSMRLEQRRLGRLMTGEIRIGTRRRHRLRRCRFRHLAIVLVDVDFVPCHRCCWNVSRALFMPNLYRDSEIAIDFL